MNKSCGNCRYWLKLKSIKGLCDKFDLGWAKSDHQACDSWKRIRDDKKPREKLKVSDYLDT